MENQKTNAFVIVCFSVSQGAIDYMKQHEQFDTLEEAQTYKKAHYQDKGYFWTGLEEYKIVEVENGKLKNAFGCNQLHIEYIRRHQ